MPYTNITSEYAIGTPKKAPAFMMPTHEWKFLCRKIRALKDRPNTFREWGFVMLGMSVPALIEAYKADWASPVFDSVSVGAIVGAIFCLSFARDRKGSRMEQLASVADFIYHINERYNQDAQWETSRLQIISAIYAHGDDKRDATEAVRELVANDKAVITSGNHLAGDPFVGEGKILTVIYSFDGEKRTCVIPENSTKVIPEAV